jgi:hypothetical protein
MTIRWNGILFEVTVNTIFDIAMKGMIICEI